MHTVTFNPSSSVIVLDVKLKAAHTTIGRLVLDTGASYVVLPWKIVSAIGLKIDPQSTIQTATTATVETVPKVVVPEVQVLEKSVKNVEAIDFRKGLLSLA